MTLNGRYIWEHRGAPKGSRLPAEELKLSADVFFSTACRSESRGELIPCEWPNARHLGAVRERGGTPGGADDPWE